MKREMACKTNVFLEININIRVLITRQIIYLNI